MIAGRCLSIKNSRILATRSGFFSKKKDKAKEEVDVTVELTDKEKGALKSRFPEVFSKIDSSIKKMIETMDISKEDNDIFEENEFDSIRARGILPFTYTYNPPSNLNDIILNAVTSVLSTTEKDFSKIDISNNLKDKAALLKLLEKKLHHNIPNSRLHEMKTVADVNNFYLEPVTNVTEYIKMSRDKTVPNNVFMREEAFRFHPDDVEAYHGGVTAFPGQGGKVYGLRNKRLLREFNPRSKWYDYEEMSYDYTKVDEGLPWDPRIAKKMDSYVNRRYKINKN
ncbi:GM06185p [Strongyloides ratti]|uniref:Large ribosomal subunit protein mL50 n=1 Tax=Strongyloides ratti TaxID=34506 RepID=A0A090L5R1_STRRB|nr:GM06185p [Strongyloides ratti]CEF62824.1 GM06185p [Strongyloides ratti]